MGYYTKYSLEILSGNDGTTNYEEQIGELSGYKSSTFEESIKWYDNTKDMIEYSKKHPQTLFKLMGKGEESGDLWVQYFLNGKSQMEKGIITYGEYDPAKLK